MVEDVMTPMSFDCIHYLAFLKCCQAPKKILISLQRKLHWLSRISILPLRDGKLFIINLSNDMPADNQTGLGSTPEYQLQLQLRRFQLQLQFQLRQISRISTPTPTPEVSTPIPTPTPEFQIHP